MFSFSRALFLMAGVSLAFAVDYQMRIDVNSNVISKTLGDHVHFNLCQANGTCSNTYTLISNMLHNKAYYYNFTSTWAASSIARVHFWMELTTTLVCFDRVWISNVGTVEIGVLDGCLDQDTPSNTSCTIVELDYASSPTAYTPMYQIDPCNFTTTGAMNLTSTMNTALMTPTPAPYTIPSLLNISEAVVVGITVDSNMKATNGMAPVYFQICTMNDTYCTPTYKVVDQWVRSRVYEYQVIPPNRNAFPNLAAVWTVNLWITDQNAQVCVDKVWARVNGVQQLQQVAITGCMGNTFTVSHTSTAVPANGCSFLTVDISNTKVYTGHHVFTKWFTTSETTRCPSIMNAIDVSVNRTAMTSAPTSPPTTAPTGTGGAALVGVLFSFFVVGFASLL